MPVTMQELLDEAQVKEVMVRYCLGLDHRDFDMTAACFAEDAEIAYEGFPPYTGRNKIMEFLHSVMQVPGTMHFMGQQLVTVRGDTAKMETYLINHAWGERDGAKYLMRRGLRYFDDLARRNGVWQITRRTHKVGWHKEEPLP